VQEPGEGVVSEFDADVIRLTEHEQRELAESSRAVVQRRTRIPAARQLVERDRRLVEGESTDGVVRLNAPRSPDAAPSGLAADIETPASPAVAVICAARGRSCPVRSITAPSASPYGDPNPPVVNDVVVVMKQQVRPWLLRRSRALPGGTAPP
jgi:hypothetical protein